MAGVLIQSKGISFVYRIFLNLLILAIGLMVISQTLILYLPATLFGTAYIAMTGILLVWGTKCFPESPDLGVNLSFLLLGLGQTFGSSLAGLVIETFSYSYGFLFFAFIGIFALIIPIKIR
ncbi:hypothetical protein [Marinilactibacillus piezotolerans]|uniref:hypothetical protein n=1 Tax=Marinilactibacillus piezotolerans TaxID=258723 RepID=UPI0009B1148D|nr:hypothetical protein [Marinilactibacillus piezotolerans]